MNWAGLLASNGDIHIEYLYEYDKVVLELDGKRNETARNIYGTNLLSRKEENDSYLYMCNGHGDVTALLSNPSGSVVAEYYYDAFGNILEEASVVNNPFRVRRL